MAAAGARLNLPFLGGVPGGGSEMVQKTGWNKVEPVMIKPGDKEARSRSAPRVIRQRRSVGVGAGAESREGAMARELRLGFALGGAVSLGTFTGAAVAQALKLAILRARPKGGTERYDRVVVDVLSGASAGAMSLALLLRALVHQSEGDRREAERRLLAEFGESGDFTDDNPRPNTWRRTAAISAEVALMLHERVWGNDIHINELAGALGKVQALYAGGLLDRRAVDRIARRYLPLPGAASPGTGGVLGERVLGAMSIANLTPVIADARRVHRHPGTLEAAAADAARSNVRAELRVFDLHLADIDDDACTDPHLHPPRWCRYHVGPKRRGVIGDLRSDAFWERLGATAIASGAVPGAFEPVVLERRAWEYGPNLWPSELGRYPETPETGRAPCGSPTEYPSAKFTYVDGGAFNNEPIREAFRLASYQDGREAGMPFDRRIIFVDTFVGQEEPDYAVPIHARFGVHDKAIARLTSIDRLIPGHLPSLVSLLRDEASVVELDKVEAVRNRFQTRDRLRDLLAPETAGILNQDGFDALAAFCRRELARDQLGSLLPRAGYRLEDELLRVRREVKDSRDILGLDEAWSGASPNHREAQGRWSRALLGVVVDILMDLPGKSAEASLVPVGPFVRRADGGYARVPLPGEGMAGFLGFLARAHRPFEFRVGKRAVREALEAAELLPEGQDPPSEHPRTFTRSEEQDFEAQVERGREVLKRPLRALAEHAVRLDIGPFGIVRSFARRGLEDLLDRMASQKPVSVISVVFFVRVPEDNLEIRGIDGPDLKPVSPPLEPGDASLIVTRLTAHLIAQTGGSRWCWVGPGVDEHDGIQVITVDRHLSLFGAWTRIELPTREETLNLVARSACPTLELQLTPDDEDHVVARSRWRSSDVVAALDRTLLSEKSGRPPPSG